VFRTPGAIAHYCLTASICRVGGRLPVVRGTTLLRATCSRPAKLRFWVCPVRGEADQSAIPIAIPASGYVALSGSQAVLSCRTDLRASARNTPATPAPPNHVATVPRTTTQLCPHRRVPTATGEPTPGRWLNQSTALSGECSDLSVATTPRRRAGTRLVQWVCWPVARPTFFPCEDHPPPSTTNSWTEVSLSF